MNAHTGYPSSPEVRPWQLWRDYAPETARLLSEAEDWLPVLRQLGISGADFRAVVKQAAASNSTFQAALIESGLVGEVDLTRAVAETMDATFVDNVLPENLRGADNECIKELGKPNPIALAELEGNGQRLTTLIGPNTVPLHELKHLAFTARRQRRRLALLTPTSLRRAIADRVSSRLTAVATQGLFDWRPDLSARHRVTPYQGFMAGSGLILLAWLFWEEPVAMFIAVHVLALVFFLSCSLVRAAAAFSPRRRKPTKPHKPDAPSEMPVYSVLVALYREADVVPQLLVALGRLEWPRDRLEVKLVCEADDRATIDAIRALNPRSFVEIIEVPPSLPRTKPKALRYAMAMTSGEFVVLYDAEDRPHPQQLLEAYGRFRSEDLNLACLQAPLTITNHARALLARMFAFEYAGLFRTMLPWLADCRQMLPLGGTSNHFRRAALEEVGSWDPHNVTEDADVGVRLARCGYRTGTINLPTLESAPEQLRVWLPQRTRWLKGWLQTWLVHMRHPSQLLADLGLGSFLLAQVLLAGMFFSALLHPIIFGSAIVYAIMSLIGMSLATWQLWLIAADWAILLFSYGVFLFLGWRSQTLRERAGFPVVVALTPFYWLLISYAAWLAAMEFIRYPHRWNKTPHKPG